MELVENIHVIAENRNVSRMEIFEKTAQRNINDNDFVAFLVFCLYFYFN